MLARQHQALLDASAIASEVATARGYRTITDPAKLHALGFARACSTPGLLIPVHSVDGTVRTHQYRPDRPRLDGNGRPRKYEYPPRATMAVDVPPSVRPVIGDPSVPLVITEGARKADSAVSAGLTCVSLGGVWNWRGTNPAGGKTALPDWEAIALKGRTVYLAFDSDVTEKPEVAAALSRLRGFLSYRGATVHVLHLPATTGEKVGLDDWLAAGGTPAELFTLTTRPEAGYGHRSTPPARAPVVPRTLADVEAVFARWIRDDDPVPTRAVLAAYVANRHLDGDPVWLMLVGGSGVGKTERLAPLAALEDVVLASSITGPAALLSGTSQRERAKDASGGLLRRLPPGGGVLVLKDFTSIIDMHRDARAEVLAALREVFDGRWDRNIGTDGGRTLTWQGRCGVLAGCTTAIDSAHAVVSTMGTRFVLVRLHGDPEIAGSALSHVGGETRMRAELADAVRGLLEHLPGTPYAIDRAREPLIALANFVALARSPVDRDQQGEIRLVLDAEAPTRLVKMLAQLWRASGLLGLDRAATWQMVRRVGLDSIPKLRRVCLDTLAVLNGHPSTTDVSEAVEHPSRTTRRALEDLTAHRVVIRIPGGEGRADRWHLTPQARSWLDAALTLPASSGRVSSKSEIAEEPPLQVHHSSEFQFADDDKTGTVAPQGEAAI